MERIVKMLQHIKLTYDLEDLDILIYKAINVKNEILIEEEMRKKHDTNRAVRVQREKWQCKKVEGKRNKKNC